MIKAKTLHDRYAKKLNDATSPILKKMFKKDVRLSHYNLNVSNNEIEIELVFINTLFVPDQKLTRRNTIR